MRIKATFQAYFRVYHCSPSRETLLHPVRTCYSSLRQTSRWVAYCIRSLVDHRICTIRCTALPPLYWDHKWKYLQNATTSWKQTQDQNYIVDGYCYRLPSSTVPRLDYPTGQWQRRDPNGLLGIYPRPSMYFLDTCCNKQCFRPSNTDRRMTVPPKPHTLK